MTKRFILDIEITDGMTSSELATILRASATEVEADMPANIIDPDEELDQGGMVFMNEAMVAQWEIKDDD